MGVASAAPCAPAVPLSGPTSKSNSDSQEDGAESKTTSSDTPGEEQTENPTGEQGEVSEDGAGEGGDMDSTSCAQTGQETDAKETSASDNEAPPRCRQSPSVGEHFLFKCLLNVMLEESGVLIEMHWVDGQNKDLMNQLRTYLRNALLKSVGKI